MEYKQLSPTIVVRTSDGARVSMEDPDYVAWLEAGNSPFPPDPPEGDELASLVAKEKP